ncbi:MAG: sugar phosphate nucleotidyltransferase, partial [Promethearchaeota archaeon]
MSLPGNNFKNKLSVIILCAGKGTRLKKITKNLPKPLIKIEALNNSSILNHTINNLIKLEIKKIAIVIGYLGDAIRENISTLLKENCSLQDRLIIIDTENQYKLGSLYSFLSITKNHLFFNPNFNYLLIPGDTIFDFRLLEEILSLISKNFKFLQIYSFAFYRKIDINTFKEFYKGKKIISVAEVEKSGLDMTLKKIYQNKLQFFPSKKVMNQLIPLFVFNYDTINEILHYKGLIP